MPTDAVMSNGRRLAASGALIATAAGVAAIGLHDLRWIEWALVASAGVVGVAGLGIARKSVVAQIFSRAVSWTVFGPAAIVTVVSTLVGHHPELTAAALAGGSGAALLLARPMLHTAEARAEFAPSRFRSWLLAGATASTAAAGITGLIGLDFLYRAWHWSATGGYGAGMALLALSASLAASAFGVIRLRAWGILLGALTSLLTLASAAVMHDAADLALSLVAIPGLLFFLLPLLVAKRERSRASSAMPTRIALQDEAASLPSRVRIATDDTDPFAAELEAADAAPAPRPAARVQHV
ncbi:hypothetical protein BH11MYX4_BH11MYX4_66940 [soil metagenome]